MQNIHDRNEFKKLNEFIGGNVGGPSGGQGFATTTKASDTILGKLAKGLFNIPIDLFKRGRREYIFARLISKLNLELLRGVVLFCVEHNIDLKTGKIASASGSTVAEAGDDTSQVQSSSSGDTSGTVDVNVPTGTTTGQPDRDYWYPTGGTNERFIANNYFNFLNEIGTTTFQKKPERSQAGDVNVVRAAAISTPGLSMTANVSDLLTNRDKKKIGDREDIFKTLLRELNLAEISKTIKNMPVESGGAEGTSNSGGTINTKGGGDQDNQINPTNTGTTTITGTTGIPPTTIPPTPTNTGTTTTTGTPPTTGITTSTTSSTSRNQTEIQKEEVDKLGNNLTNLEQNRDSYSTTLQGLYPNKRSLSGWINKAKRDIQYLKGDDKIKAIANINTWTKQLREVENNILRNKTILDYIDDKIVKLGGKPSWSPPPAPASATTTNTTTQVPPASGNTSNDHEWNIKYDANGNPITENFIYESITPVDQRKEVSKFVNPYNLKMIAISAEKLLTDKEGKIINNQFKLRWARAVNKVYASFEDLLYVPSVDILQANFGDLDTTKLDAKVDKLVSEENDWVKVAQILTSIQIEGNQNVKPENLKKFGIIQLKYNNVFYSFAIERLIDSSKASICCITETFDIKDNRIVPAINPFENNNGVSRCDRVRTWLVFYAPKNDPPQLNAKYKELRFLIFHEAMINGKADSIWIYNDREKNNVIMSAELSTKAAADKYLIGTNFFTIANLKEEIKNKYKTDLKFTKDINDAQVNKDAMMQNLEQIKKMTNSG